MSKIAVVGDRQSVLVYKAFGMESVPAENPAEAIEAIRSLAEDDYAVIFLTEQLAEQIPGELAKYSDKIRPAIIMIPGSKGSLGIGMASVSAAVEQAIGADIFASADAERTDKQ